MGSRTITDREIALIKAMLSKGMKNQKIQFFFNRPGRPVNSGRISTIRSGTYSNSSKISASSDAELEQFIAQFSEKGQLLSDLGSLENLDTSLSAKARALFKKTKDGNWILNAGESEECECKQDFDPKKISKVIRAIAALANNKGGYIFFGISNAKFQIEGVSDDFIKTDIAQIIEKVKAHLSPTPTILGKEIIDFDGKAIGFIYVEKYSYPPIIIYRDGDGLNEGEILFRYPGQSARIKFGDLRAMLDARDRRAQVALADAAGRLADVGTENAIIVDTEKNILDAKGHSILIDENLVESIKFIKEGQFDEKKGAPALKLIGEVAPIAIKGDTAKIVSHEAIFQEHILERFLKQAKVSQPIQYIYAGLAQSRQWVPIFYYARLSGKTNAELIKLVEGLKVSQKGKKKVLLERLQGGKNALSKIVSQASAKILVDLTKGKLSVPLKIEDVVPFAHAITAIKSTKLSLEDLLAALISSRDIAEKADDSNALGAIFKAACRVDELFFFKA